MSSSGSATRRCSRQTCTRDAVTTLTYVYSDSTAVVGPLAGHAEPHAYDLCAVHADRLTAPRGWRVVRLELPETLAHREDRGAVADAVGEPEPPAPVRDRPRAVLRDVSLPLTATPREASRDASREAPREREGRRAPEPAWHDVPVPETLRRAHLRRPAGRGDAALPEA